MGGRKSQEFKIAQVEQALLLNPHLRSARTKGAFTVCGMRVYRGCNGVKWNTALDGARVLYSNATWSLAEDAKVQCPACRLMLDLEDQHDKESTRV